MRARSSRSHAQGGACVPSPRQEEDIVFREQIRIAAIVTVVVMTQIGIAYAETNYERIKREGVVRVGSHNEAPFTFTLPDGAVVGEDYELAKLVFERLGIKKVEPV